MRCHAATVIVTVGLMCTLGVPSGLAASRLSVVQVALRARLVATGASATPGSSSTSPDVSVSSTAVWGQADFNSVDHPCARPTSATLCGPTQAVPDDQGNLWVADLVYNRVLEFRAGSGRATLVLGQYGAMSTRACDRSPPRRSSYPSAPNRYTLCQPTGLAIDQHGTLYVADSLNNRILVYFHAARKHGSAPADRVLGQTTFHASASNAVPAGGQGRYRCLAPHPASACTLNSPMELSLTAGGDLLVPDLDNHRVLLWPAASLAHLHSRSCVPSCYLPASRVWGQYGSFRTSTKNNPVVPVGVSSRCTPITRSTPTSACTLSEPWSALADGEGNLFVADTANNRVLEYDHGISTGRQDATQVFGQAASFVTSVANLGGVTASSLWHPAGMGLDPGGNLWVTDVYNMRVLAFAMTESATAGAADRVLGQSGAFTTNACHVRADGLCGPTGIAFDAAGHAFVADAYNSRVLAYFSVTGTAARSNTVPKRSSAGTVPSRLAPSP